MYILAAKLTMFVSDKYRRKIQAMIYEKQPHWKYMSNTRRGLPITDSRIEQIFPKLTPAQLTRIAARGHIRAMKGGEVLYEQGHRGTVLCGCLRGVRGCATFDSV